MKRINRIVPLLPISIQITDPLNTCKDNIDTIKNLVELSTLAIAKRTDTLLKSIKLTEQKQQDPVDKIAEDTEQMKKYQKESEERLLWYSTPLGKD